MSLLEELRRDVEATATLVNQIELDSRAAPGAARLHRGRRRRGRAKSGGGDRAEADRCRRTLIELRSTGRGQDGVRWGAKLLGKLNYLANGLASADDRPTSQQLEVQKLHEERIAAAGRQVDAILGKELAALNQLLRSRNLPTIVVGAGKSGT